MDSNKTLKLAYKLAKAAILIFEIYRLFHHC